MKTRNIILSALLSATFAITFTSCDTNKEEPQVNPEISTGVYVLNEGKFLGNNASLSYYDLTTSIVANDVFTTKNNRKLGDTGQDILKYGSKVYIAVYGSSLIEVIDAATGISKKTIPMLNAGLPSSPRSLASYNGKIYISLFDGHVAQLDTTTLIVEKTVAVGSNPEGIVVANNKIYVANSGGMALKNDSTISVIDPVSFTVIRNIKVVINPSIIKADAYGDLYVLSFGNYGTIPYTFQRIEAATIPEKVTVITNLKPYNFTIDGDNAYLYSYDYDANWNPTNKSYTIYDVKNEQVLKSNFISSSAIVNTPYSIDVNPITKDIYIGESDYKNAGKMNVFGQDGVLKFSFVTGLNPRKTIFLTKK